MLFYPSPKVICNSAIEHVAAARDHVDIVAVLFCSSMSDCTA
jgi:hypothetical protein